MANTAFERIEDYNDISTHGQYQLALDEGLEPAEALKVVQFHSRDNARTPMQWTTEAQAGFTTGTPWLPVHEDFASCCAEVEEKDDQSVLSYYRKLQHERFRGKRRRSCCRAAMKNSWLTMSPSTLLNEM